MSSAVASSNAQETVNGLLEKARRDLLDLSLRNPLLNFRLLKSKGLEVVDELSVEVFRLLVTERRQMVFLPISEDPEEEEEVALEDSETEAGQAEVDLPQPSLDVESEQAVSGPPVRHLDRQLQTALTAAELQKRLLKTYYDARTFIEEQGVNLLFLALGMVEWYEADASHQPRRAPLLLIPVELVRGTALDKFHLRYTEEDFGPNLSLEAKLKNDFGVTAPPLPDSEDLDLAAYFASFQEAIRLQKRWRVHPDAIVLSFFSFGKFLMFRDLDPETWPEGFKPADHPIVSALFGDGFGAPLPSVPDDAFLDRILQAQDLTTVVDADSTQSLAILDVAAGRNLVVQGPPGTGKSQTITNVIAQALHDGKRILFVAEKMAALEVVKRRLDRVGLGEACLELHSHRTTKHTLLQELQRTLDLGRPLLGQLETQVQLLGQTRDRLNDYCDAVNTPIADSGLTPFVLYGKLLDLQRISDSDNWPLLRFPALRTWSGAEFAARNAQVAELQARVQQSGVPDQHPFWGSVRNIVLPTDQAELRRALTAAKDSLTELRVACHEIATQLGIQVPTALADTVLLRDGLRRALQAPPPDLHFSAPEWLTQRAELEALLEAGIALATIHQRRDAELVTTAWTLDVQALRGQLASYETKWWRSLAGGYRSARTQLKAWCAVSVPKTVAAQVALLDDVLAAQRQRAIVEAHAELGRSLFGSHWAGPASDWPQLKAWTEWVLGLRQDIAAGRIPSDLPRALEDPGHRAQLAANVARVENALSTYQQQRQTVVDLLQFDAQRRFHSTDALDQQSLTDQATLLNTWSQHLDMLPSLVSFNVAAESCRNNGLGDLVAFAEHWPPASRHLTDLLAMSRYTTLIEDAMTARPALHQFSGASHEQVVGRFRELDQLNNAYHQKQLALRHWQALPHHDGGGQLAILRHEFNKKSRHLPIRQLMTRAGLAIQAIKPVFMMSPLSIAAYLPPGSVTFDLVVFDEASQVRPVDGLGALLRGAQAVVVGDNRQLPPTSFFDLVTQNDDLNEDLVTSDVESILGTFLAKNAPSRMLRWHYRSRHESLINVSNHAFYDDRLVVFPSPDADRSQVGLRFHHLSQTSYDRGGTRTNPEEAREVVRAVMRHARANPDLTLGVVAFSVAQKDAILDQLELMRRRDPSCEAFFAAHLDEPFFVKNLENVQGDERDVVFISVGYGRSAEGYLTYNFGPLSQEGGERRLNVLITRARMRCEVFTNLTADDLDLTKAKGRGVQALKLFLRYAQTGVLDIPTSSGKDAESPFEEAVCTALESAGYQVDKQVGSGGFFIDLAVRDPEHPGGYVLAIECDGASYHSARSARDRDRLRQQVLEGLGWNFHRIWSTDWFRNPDEELRKTVVAIELALTNKDQTRPEAPVQLVPPLERDEISAPPGLVTEDNYYIVAHPSLKTYGLEIHELGIEHLADAVCQVVEIESPVHIDEIVHRVTEAAGKSRAGSRIRGAIQRAATLAVTRGTVQLRGRFLWRPDMAVAPVRDRSRLPTTSRQFRLVAPEEIEQAVLRAVRAGYGLTPDTLPGDTCRLLGFQRVSEDMSRQIRGVVRDMLGKGLLSEQGGFLIVRADATGHGQRAAVEH